MRLRGSGIARTRAPRLGRLLLVWELEHIGRESLTAQDLVAMLADRGRQTSVLLPQEGARELDPVKRLEMGDGRC